jgi:NADPH:quinone reductase-like Zn-dependent oxidoreductase
VPSQCSYRGRYVYEPKLPAGLGYEAAGIVESVGPDVDQNWIGKQVSIIPAFSLNEYSMVGETALAPVKALAEYPAKLSWFPSFSQKQKRAKMNTIVLVLPALPKTAVVPDC